MFQGIVSQWMISVGDRGAMPYYRGSLRIEPDTGRVERLQTESCDLPAWFPASRVESTIDYQAVAIGAQEYFLLVHSEMLTCFRRENYCVRNAIALPITASTAVNRASTLPMRVGPAPQWSVSCQFLQTRQAVCIFGPEFRLLRFLQQTRSGSGTRYSKHSWRQSLLLAMQGLGSRHRSAVPVLWRIPATDYSGQWVRVT
jgi:hypothetical protein